MSDNKKMESLELSPINQENYSDLEMICKLIEDLLSKYCSEAMAFSAIDVNNEDMIGINEFTSELQNNFNIDDVDKIQCLFEMFDQDKDGNISKQDWELSFQEYPLKLVHIEQNSASQNSELNQIETNSNQLHQSIGGTPYRSQGSINYQQNYSPSCELAEIQAKLNNSPGLDGLMRKCNALKIQSHTQAAVSSQFYQQHIDNGLEMRQQLLITNNIFPQNFLKVEDNQVKQIFGEFKTPSKDPSRKLSQNDIEVAESQQNQQQVQSQTNQNVSENKERLSVPIDARLILSQKIVSPICQQKLSKEIEEVEGKQSVGLLEQGVAQQYTNPLFVQSNNKVLEFPYEARMQRILQSSSPIDQYKGFNNGSSNGLNYQMGFSNLKWEVQNQQQQFKPKKDYKNNFQSYLSLIGLGSNRSNHHGTASAASSATGNQLYFANKGGLQNQSSNKLQQQQQQQYQQQQQQQQLYRVSSTERSSFRNAPSNIIPFTANNSNLTQPTNKRRTGLEGIIDKINIKKDSLFSKKGQSNHQSTLNQQSLLLGTNQQQTNQSSTISSSTKANNLIKLSRIHPNSHLSSKQTELEGSLEKIRLISMQRNINYGQGLTKENNQSLKLSPYQYLKSSQQQQQPLNQPLAQTLSSLRNNQGSFIPSQVSSIGVAQKSTQQQQQYFKGDKLSATQPKGLGQTLEQTTTKQQLLQKNQNTEAVISQQIQQQKDVENDKVLTNQVEQQQKVDLISQQNEPNQFILTPDAFEDYDDIINAYTQESEQANFNFVSESAN